MNITVRWSSQSGVARNNPCKQAHAIVDFREKYPKEARRLRGIDACSKEIGYRLEVFAQTHRNLRNHIVYSRANSNIDKKQNYKHVELEPLSMTYHIGEDYLDVIDGLREIDEAIHFLRLDCGSRIGHALALCSKVIEIKVSHQLIQCAKEVQREMQRWISGLDIGIETNPSSDYLIGSFKHYDKHPIFAFYNLGLSSLWEEINGCSQHPVCVNTDDQGIFSTYLENEYALLALVLEKAKDENGRKKYRTNHILSKIFSEIPA